MPAQHFNNILVAVDGSFQSSIAARYSYHIAGYFESRLYIVSVLTPDMTENRKQVAALSVETILNETRKRGIEAEGVMLTGDVTEAIRKFVIHQKIDLVFASTRTPHREKRFFARSVTSRFMADLPCPVIGLKISHPGRSIRPRKLLIPIAGGNYKVKERADIVEALSKSFKCSTVVFHVVELNDLRTIQLNVSTKEKLMASAENKVSDFVAELRKRSINVSEKITVGRSARKEIISEASHHRYDLIVIGATRRNVLKKIVSGNPVEEILRDTPCDVMLIHF